MEAVSKRIRALKRTRALKGLRHKEQGHYNGFVKKDKGFKRAASENRALQRLCQKKNKGSKRAASKKNKASKRAASKRTRALQRLSKRVLSRLRLVVLKINLSWTELSAGSLNLIP